MSELMNAVIMQKDLNLYKKVLLHSLIHSFTHLLIFFPILAQTPTGVGPNEGYYAVHDLADDWQVFDARNNVYIPYIAELHADQPSVSAFVDLESNRNYKLLVRTERNGYLFLEAALKRKLLARQWQVLSIDSLYRIYRKPQLFITLYGAAGAGDKSLLIGHPRSTRQTAMILTGDNLSVRPRPVSPYADFFGLGLLFLLTFSAFLLVTNRRAFVRFYDPRDLFTLRVRDDSFLVNKPLEPVSVLFVLNLSFLLAFLLLFVESRNIDLFAARALLPAGASLLTFVGAFVLISVLIFGLLLGKYALLSVLGGLYKLANLSNVHYFKVIQSSLLFFTVVLLIVAVIATNSTSTDWLENQLLLPFVAFYMARLALLYATLTAGAPVKNLYLFSYLCLVELIPLIVGVRFAL
jgi:hypothetical protein